MKYTIIMICALLSINLKAQDSLQLGNTEYFSKQVFTAFKTNDYELFRSLFITEKSHEFLLQDLNEGDSLKTIYRQRGQANVKYLQNQAKQNFESMLNTAKQNNINWLSAEILEVQYIPRSKDKTEHGDIVINLKSQEILFYIVLSDCYKANTWNIANKVKLIVKN